MTRINQDKGYDLKLTLVIFEEKVCGKKSPMKIHELSHCKLFILNHK